ncbi:hypothetical protein PSTG_18241 [Puccinia striiformis f. sp. tritici PST-78]|uniref:Uncharacterized protein n=1 Tax=Puccinia striiformis f. sp. tritici PST-78 TaxID=1165861 RepID=A0A0L0UNL9_9BASI|nr:hypothetical protein PSTG_18241 [Puccinia striiformis f. sp. tritici PST-78]
MSRKLGLVVVLKGATVFGKDDFPYYLWVFASPKKLRLPFPFQTTEQQMAQELTIPHDQR